MEKLNFNQVCDYLRHWSQETPDKDAAVYNGERLSWSELHFRVEKLACRLMEFGVERGDRVAMLSPARNEYLITYLATLMIGGIWYGLHPRYKRPEMKYMLEDAGAKVIVTVDSYQGIDFQEDIQAIRQECPSIAEVIVIGEQTWSHCRKWDLPALNDEQRARLERRIMQIEPSDGALIVYTSGTTGKPKGVLLTHLNILKTMAVQNNHFGLEQSSSALIHFPINHIACSTELTIGSLLSGAKMVFLDKFHPVETLETVQSEKITMFGQIPTMFLLEFALPDYDEYDLSSVKTYIWAGSAAPESMVRRLQQTGARLLTGYGMTELSGFVTYTATGAADDELIKGAGVVDPAFELKLVDQNRNDLSEKQIADGVIGEIAVRGDCVMAGYWAQPEQTADVIDKNGWLYTGDMSRIDHKGNIYLAGRIKDMFKSGGFNIYPREIEAIIESAPEVAMVSVIPVADPIFQEVGKALIVAKKDHIVDIQKIDCLCREKLANFKIPKSYEIVDAFPLLPNGKLDHKAIKSKYGNLSNC